jgi:hypothetical protein
LPVVLVSTIVPPVVLQLTAIIAVSPVGVRATTTN